ncbi:MAG: hypothetical protein PHP42_07415 [Bacteroidota bacterium]|nr:hypothetical protein [Bacteroidota bacterium]
MKIIFIVIFALAMFVLAKLCCQTKPEWSTRGNSEHEIHNTMVAS